MKRCYFLIFCLVCLATPAYASVMGDTIQIDWRIPNVDTTYASHTGTVTAGGLVWNTYLGVDNITVNDGTISLYNVTNGWAGADGFNGFVFTDLTKSPPFTSLSLVSKSGYPPPVDPILTFNDNQLFINFNASSVNNIGVSDGTLYTFAFTTGSSSVPIPAAVWLFGTGLLGLAGIRRKMRA